MPPPYLPRSMFRRFHLLLPSAASPWEAWSCPSASTSTLLETTAAPARPAKASGPLTIALPAKSCRTLALLLPSQDPKIIRQLAFAQLEKRGLAAATPEHTRFHCHAIPAPQGTSIISIDVVAPEAAAALLPLQPLGLLPSARCYLLPQGPLVLAIEHQRLVLWAAHRSHLIHTHILSSPRANLAQIASEIHLASLTLLQQNLLPEVTALQLWGDFSPAETDALRAALPWPVSAQPRPNPDPAHCAQVRSALLLPSANRSSHRSRQRLLLKVAAAAALLAAALYGTIQPFRALAALENQAAHMDQAINAASGSNLQQKALSDLVRASQERWSALRMALDSRRYPLIQLNHLTRTLGQGNLVLERFEAKGPDLSLSGTAQSALEAYRYFSAINTDPDLRLYDWSMVQPVLAATGTASFQIKGKMR